MKKSPILIHIPHASAVVPPEERAKMICPDLAEELRVMTDWYTDGLFGCGAEQLAFPVSRLVCDPERFRDDAEESMSAVGMGAVYTRCSDGSSLRQVTPEQREDLLRRWYDPHHRALNAMTAQRLSEFGCCLIIDAHSFYPTALPYERQGAEKLRPDVCIGTDGFHTLRALFESAAAHFTAAGYTVAENTPFAGALVPAAYYRRDSRVQSVMIEVNRRVYLDENAEKTAGFEPLHRCIEAWVTELQNKK